MSGRGGNRRRSGRRRDSSETARDHYGRNERPARIFDERNGGDRNRAGFYDRPRWTPPLRPAGPLPSPDCPYCGEPIRDISQAVTDRGSGAPVHFDCVIARIAEGEALEDGDSVTYIGGGRFGIVHFNNPGELQRFRIKKVLEWEDKENRAEWRRDISDHYSLT
ncbi:MAG: hypothetical protein LBQ55_03620 [Treponema sp.]|jgi:hypothetical protein|nr:hypothetical protein [Treponema sp.]